jgi:hypothetical protein
VKLTDPIISQLETKLGIPAGFFENLLNEDDWSFIIKLDALIEASLTHQLVEVLSTSISEFSSEFYDREKIEKFVSWLDLSNPRTSKLTLAVGMGLMLDNHPKFVRLLAEIRNNLVHDIRNTNFNLGNYVSLLRGEKRDNFFNTLRIDSKNKIIRDKFDKEIDYDEFILRYPKLSIWFTASDLLSEIAYCVNTFQLEKENHSLTRQINQESRKILDMVLSLVEYRINNEDSKR